MKNAERNRNQPTLVSGRRSRLLPGGQSRTMLPGAAVIVLLTLTAYIPALRSGFIWDDDTFLTQNPRIKASDGLYRFWFTRESPDYFPLTSSMLWVEWRLWGMNAVGYHTVNVLLHGISAVLIWRVLKRLGIPGAWLAGLVFAVHPVNVETVAWITERKNTLPLLFYLLTILLYFEFEAGRRKLWYILSVAAFLLALLSKTSVVMLPLVLLGCAWWRREKITRQDLLLTVPFWVLSIAMGLLTVWFQYSIAIGETVVRTDGFFSRLAVAGSAVWFYLYKTLLPIHLAFVYPRWNLDASSVLAYVPGLILAAVFVLFWRYRKGWGRPLLAAMGYYVLNLMPVLGFLNIYFMKFSLVADHWQYVAIIGVIALVVGLAAHLFNDRSKPTRQLGMALGTIGVTTLSILTWRQAIPYRNEETIWRATLARNPSAWIAHVNLGKLLSESDKRDEAIEHYRKALRLNPVCVEAHNNLGFILAGQNKQDEAIRHYREALWLNPLCVEAHKNLGFALSSQGKLDEAIEHYRITLRLNPAQPDVHNNAGIVLSMQDKLDEAVAHYTTALQLNPDYPNARYNLGVAFARQGKLDQAMTCYRQAMRLAPDSPRVLNDLAWLLATTEGMDARHAQEAIDLAEQALHMTGPDEPNALDTLAAAYAARGRFDEATSAARRALQAAERRGNAAAAAEFRRRLTLYESHRPYREPPASQPKK